MNKGDLLVSKELFFLASEGIEGVSSKHDFCLVLHTGSFAHTIMMFGKDLTPLTTNRHPDYISKHYIPIHIYEELINSGSSR